VWPPPPHGAVPGAAIDRAPLFTQLPRTIYKISISPPRRTMEWFEFILCFGSHALILSFFDNATLLSNPYPTAASLLLPLLLYRLLSSPMIVTRSLSDVPLPSPPPPPHPPHAKKNHPPTPSGSSSFIHPRCAETHARHASGSPLTTAFPISFLTQLQPRPQQLPPFPSGWFRLCKASDLRLGQVIARS
jgi:hypothetical protein